jgi:hypothetical protein
MDSVRRWRCWYSNARDTFLAAVVQEITIHLALIKRNHGEKTEGSSPV